VPDVIGVSLRNIDPARSYDHFQYLRGCAQTLAAARAGAPRALTVVGGAGYSLFPEAALEYLDTVDAGVAGEGESSLRRLLDHLDGPSGIPGLVLRGADGRWTLTGPPAEEDLDRLPLPDRDCVDLAPYRGATELQVGVESHRGCAMRCTYCSYPLISGCRTRLRSVDRVLEDVENLVRRGVTRFFFTDPSFNAVPDHVLGICEALAESGLRVTWSAYFGERQVTAELVRACAGAGCVSFIFGPDSGSDPILERLRKGVTRRQIVEAYETVRREAPRASFKSAFLLDAPGETWRTSRETLGLALRQVLRGRCEVSLSGIRVYPGTEIHRIAVAEGLLDPADDLLRPTFYRSGRLGPLLLAVNLASRVAVGVLRLLRRPV
jgi:radical SAM superfamily enzyme YgiQ (UPF0313 family)